ncbi:hypothetical protein L7F22_068473 [Adiantum nelumboides]|nr:hypothetical protein [Adiantum nelumboides]MCO5614193.1 hypothetical protein [Adiantum nelumboides]
MYLSTCQRIAFYEGVGLNTKIFDMHVIIETNRTTACMFSAILNVEFKAKLDRMVEYNEKLMAIGNSDSPNFVKNMQRVLAIAGLVGEIVAAYFISPVDSGSVDVTEFEPQLVY